VVPSRIPGRNRRFLLVGTEVHDRRPEQSFPDDAHAAGPARARVLLVEDHLFDERDAAPAVLGGPAQTDPPVAAELLFPFPALVEQLVLVAGPAAAAHLGEVAIETIGEPCARVGTERLLGGSEAQVHERGTLTTAATFAEMDATGTAVVTGASRGIGRAVATELARRGFDVIATMRDPQAGATLADEAGSAAGSLRVERFDVTDQSSFTMPDGLRVLVNNAGVEDDNLPIEVMPETIWRRMFETNVFGAVETIRYAIPRLRQSGGGVICNITSSSILAPVPFLGAYRASKAALSAIGESLAAEVRQFGIRVVEVMPGPIETDMLATSDRPAAAIEHDEYRALAERMWESRQQVRSSYTPTGEAAQAIVDAILDDHGPLRYGCDPLSTGMLGGWNTADNAGWVQGMLSAFG
jgi:NAD(P)-dependent dehydrogenase (short-subunit alcohol dehydrogenase family)